MYGVTESTYELVTKTKGSYELFKKSIKLLKDNNIHFELKFIVMRQNIIDLYKFVEFAKELDVNMLISFNLFPTSDKNKSPLLYRVTPEEAFEFEITDDNRRMFWDKVAVEQYERIKGIRTPKIIERRDTGCLYNCNISYRDTFINSQGMMQACIRTSYDSYDLLKYDFSTVWKKLEENFRNKKASADFKCNKCELLEYCEQCSAIFKQKYDDPEVIDSFFCTIAKYRKEYVDSKVRLMLDKT